MSNEELLWKRLEVIHKRIEWMASAEAQAAWVNGAAADGRFFPEKERLVAEAERIVDELETGLRSNA